MQSGLKGVSLDTAILVLVLEKFHTCAPLMLINRQFLMSCFKLDKPPLIAKYGIVECESYSRNACKVFCFKLLLGEK